MRLDRVAAELARRSAAAANELTGRGASRRIADLERRQDVLANLLGAALVEQQRHRRARARAGDLLGALRPADVDRR